MSVVGTMMPIGQRSFIGSKSVSAHYNQQLKQAQPDNVRNISTAPSNWASVLKESIQSVLAQCQYGKNIEGLLMPERGFRASNLDGDVMLLNYGEPIQKAPPFKGVCNELAYAVGTFLKKKFNNNIVIQAARGACDDYFPFGIHYFLLAWPAAKQGKMTKKIQQGQGQVPDSCLLIDPSFNKLIPPKENSTERLRYRLEEVFDLEQLHPHKDGFSIQQCPLSLPIGYIKDLIPAAVKEYGAQALLFLAFTSSEQRPSGPPDFEFIFQRTPSTLDPEPAGHLLQMLPLEHPLRHFHSRIEADLAQTLQIIGSDETMDNVKTETNTDEVVIQQTMDCEPLFEPIGRSVMDEDSLDRDWRFSLDWQGLTPEDNMEDWLFCPPTRQMSTLPPLSPLEFTRDENDNSNPRNFDWIDDLLSIDQEKFFSKV